MKSKKLAQLIRKLVKEEVTNQVQSLLSENKKEVITNKTKNISKKQYTSNSALNDILNETVQNSDYKTLKTFDAKDARAGFAAMQNPISNPIPDKNISGAPMDPSQVTPDIMNALTRDYTELVKRFK
tara:strand:+ start:345 stop:725 length:381 start_codon:yes stop_codon:yes gene_type:complete